LFEDTRIKCFYTDQSDYNSLEKTILSINEHYGENIYFDLIIDDGSHIVDHMITTFQTYKKYLKNNGLYIIEDIKQHEIPIFLELETKDLKVIKIHEGNFKWDSFVAFQKID